MPESLIPYGVSLVISLLFNHPVPAAAARIRPLSVVLERSLLDGYTRSPTMRCLVNAIEDSNVIVHVVSGMRSDGIAGRLIFVTSAGGQRFLRVVIDPAMPPLARTATLGHELQHAREVASAPWVIDQASFKALFHDIGYPAAGVVGAVRFETDAARQIGRRVLADLQGLDRGPGNAQRGLYGQALWKNHEPRIARTCHAPPLITANGSTRP